MKPLCDNKDIEEPEPANEEDEFTTVGHLQKLATSKIQAREQPRRKRHRTARAYVRLRRQHAHAKAQRALRWRLRRICQQQAEVREVQA